MPNDNISGIRGDSKTTENASRQQRLRMARRLLDVWLAATVVFVLIGNLYAWVYRPDRIPAFEEPLLFWSGLFLLLCIYCLASGRVQVRMVTVLGLCFIYGMVLALIAVKHHALWHPDMWPVLLSLVVFFLVLGWLGYSMRLGWGKRRIAEPSANKEGSR